ncbi:MAG: hypothetical protein CMG60_00745 [Candidatus Marinimicrobia bacterium]|nr:hypothetical protein [Candidatus Neomarinimicrobiota bacterium]|tara:strand:- start:9193 stop:10698 length:1506 start_codon:yes stop_codon:yes gene_type:complete
MKSNSPKALSLSDRLDFLFKDSILYGGASALGKAFALITFPIFTRYFSTNDYGILDYFLVLPSFLTVLIIFGQDAAVARYFYEYEDSENKSKVISQSFVFQILIIILIIPILWINAGWFSKYLIEYENTEDLFKLVILQLPFAIIINFSSNLLKWTFQRKLFLTLTLGFTVARAIIIIFSISFFDVSIINILEINLYVSILFSLIGYFSIKHWISDYFNFDKIIPMLKYGIPFGIIFTMGAFSPIIERTLTLNYLGSSQLAHYAVGVKITMIITLATNAFQTAWGPFFLSLFKESKSYETYNLVLKLFTIVICILVCTTAAFSSFLIKILATNKYQEAQIIVFPLALAVGIKSISWITEIGISLSKKSFLAIYVYLSNFIVLIFSIIILTPKFGLLGIGFSVLFSQIASGIISSYLGQLFYPIDWDYKSALSIIVTTFSFGFLAYYGGFVYSKQLEMVFYLITIIITANVSWIYALTSSDKVQIYNLYDKYKKRLPFNSTL